MEFQSLTIPLPKLNLPRLSRALRRIGLKAKDFYSTALPKIDAGLAEDSQGGRSETGASSCRQRSR